jgi:serine/threonine-protein kinase
MTRKFAQLEDASRAQILEICDRFDGAWQAASAASAQERPVLEDYLAQAQERVRSVLLRELLQVELEYRTKRGEKFAIDEYLGRLRDHRETVAHAWRQMGTGPASAQDTFRPWSGFTVPSTEELAAKLTDLKGLVFIKQGGMGAVYKATDDLDRLVAIKILPPELGQDPEFRKRFKEEAKALARLDHSNIVRIYNLCHRDDLFYFVMEYAEKGNLRDRINKNAGIPYNEAIDITLQVCEGLQFAHENSVLHRDIKPENILVFAQSRVKVADFGIAKLLDPQRISSFHTESNRPMGTDGYMAPEQRRAEKDIDCRADIFSLGVVLYELLTGELPEGAFDPPSEKGNSPQWLDDVVRRALRPRRDDRFRDVREMADSIRKNHKLLVPGNSLAPVSQLTLPHDTYAVDTARTASFRFPDDLIATLGEGISAENLATFLQSLLNAGSARNPLRSWSRWPVS